MKKLLGSIAVATLVIGAASASGQQAAKAGWTGQFQKPSDAALRKKLTPFQF